MTSTYCTVTGAAAAANSSAHLHQGRQPIVWPVCTHLEIDLSFLDAGGSTHAGPLNQALILFSQKILVPVAAAGGAASTQQRR
jgi:hypothetical protein